MESGGTGAGQQITRAKGPSDGRGRRPPAATSAGIHGRLFSTCGGRSGWSRRRGCSKRTINSSSRSVGGTARTSTSRCRMPPLNHVHARGRLSLFLRTHTQVPNGGWVLAEATSEDHGPTTLCNELKVHAGGYPPLSNIPNPDKQGQASTAACTQTRATCEGAMIQFALSAPIRR